jgi:outer membrane protein OmpA-like peptidoglycan-associated protein
LSISSELYSNMLRVSLCACVGLLTVVAAALGQQRSFVSCPIVRDTRTVPCFLAEYDGEVYYLGIQQDITSDFHPPQLKHEALVEGTVVPGRRVCGGIPLQPVSISVVKEINLACNTLLPAEPGIDAPPAPRGAGPSSRRPDTVIAPGQPLTGRREFTVLYSFNDDYLEFAANKVVTEAASYAKRTGASSVKITGYSAASLLSNGQRLTEKPWLAEKRAQNIATLMRGLGVAILSVDWKIEGEPADGLRDPSRRRVSIMVTP